MGSPNFSITSGSKYVRGLAWGLVPSHPTDEDVRESIENGDWMDPSDEDEIRECLYQDNADHVSDMYAYIKNAVDSIKFEALALWCGQNFDEGVFPFNIELEQGYHCGFSVGIVDALSTREWIGTYKYQETVWDHHASWDRYFQDIEMSYANYWRAVDSVADFMQWALDQMARCYGLQIVTGGGWTQGTEDYNWDEYEPHDQADKWAERYPHFNYKLLWDEFGDFDKARKVDWRERKLSELKDKHLWSVWVGGVEINDHYVTWREANYKANQYREDGYDDVAIKLNKVWL